MGDLVFLSNEPVVFYIVCGTSLKFLTEGKIFFIDAEGKLF